MSTVSLEFVSQVGGVLWYSASVNGFRNVGASYDVYTNTALVEGGGFRLQEADGSFTEVPAPEGFAEARELIAEAVRQERMRFLDEFFKVSDKTGGAR